MPSTRALKNRIRSVDSTKQITKAMQLVAASKMRRAQEADKASAPYTMAAEELLSYLASQGATDNHPLFVRRKINKRLIIVVASDKGLAGAYNTNVLKKYLELLKRDDERGIENLTLTIGRRASQFATRLKDTKIIGTYEDLPDQPSGLTFHTILNTAVNMFENGEVDAVTLVYTRFVNNRVRIVDLTEMRKLNNPDDTFNDIALYMESLSRFGTKRSPVSPQQFNDHFLKTYEKNIPDIFPMYERLEAEMAIHALRDMLDFTLIT